MNKNELVREIEDAFGNLTREEARKIINLIVSCIKTTLYERKEFRLNGLGVFRVRQIKSRPARNPLTGKKITVKSHGRVKFTPAESLKKLVK